jgi:hypothetical protein
MAVREEILIGSKADTRGFKKAETAAAKLTKQVRSLGSAIGLSLGTAAFVSFGKALVKAFTDAEKSNTQLANSVKNLGLAFGQANIVSFLDKISASSGIAGEILNESFQGLLTTTGSILKSQELLQLALDVSAGSGKSLVTVSNDLGQAFVGNTRGLRKYNLGLTQAQLKTASFLDLQTKLNKQFSGSNQAFLLTYAGKLQVLTEAAGNAQEIIGKGLVDALTLAGGKDTDIEDVGNAMAGLAEYTADTVRGLGVISSYITSIDSKFSGGFLGKLISGSYDLVGIGRLRILADLGNQAQARPTAGRRFMGGAQANLYDADAAAQKRFQAQQKKFQDAQVKSTKALTAEQKKQNALKKAGTIFDLEQVQLIAALKGKLSDEDRKRVELQFALLVGNTSEATKLTYELAKAQGLGEKLASYLASLPDAKNPFASWEAYLDMLAEKARKIAIGGGSGGAVPITPITPSVATNATNAGGFAYSVPNPSAGGSRDSQFGSQTPWALAVAALNRPVVVQIDGKAVATSLQDTSMSGITSNINRTSGGFGL